MELKLPKETIGKVVAIFDSIEDKTNIFNQVEFVIDSDCIYLNSPRCDAMSTMNIKFPQPFKGFGRVIFTQDVDRIYSVFKDAVRRNIDVDFLFEEENSSGKAYMNGILVSNRYQPKSRKLEDPPREEDGYFLKMNKEEFLKNFSDFDDFAISMEWKDKDQAGTSFVFKGNEVFKTTLAPSVFTFDEIYGDVNKQAINRSFQHGRGHFVFTKELFNIINNVTTAEDNISFLYNESFGLDVNTTDKHLSTLGVYINGNITLSLRVMTRPKHCQSYEDHKGWFVSNTLINTFNVDRDLFESLFSKIVSFKNFETENIYLQFSKSATEIVDESETTLAKISTKNETKEKVKIGFNVYVLNRIFKYSPEKSVLTFSYKKIDEENKYIVVNNSVDNRSFIIHAL